MSDLNSDLNSNPNLQRDAENPDASTKLPAKSLLDSAISLVGDDLDAVNNTIQWRLQSDIALINTLGAYIVKSGGKRLRPLILLLCARCCGYPGKDHVLLAAVIEFIHTATLLHDDVVDASATRRGQPTVNDVWGNEASVLVGDFLYSRAFEMMVETRNMAVMRILANTTNAIAEGEVLQLLNAHSPDTSEQQYMDTIHRKTAKLFESAAWLGGIIAGERTEICNAMASYGMHLGTAFQLVDDILDYSADSADLGKDIGDDLAEGKPTLPLIYALEHGNTQQKAIIAQSIENGKREKIAEILDIVQSTGALDYARAQANDQVELAVAALAPLNDNEYKDALAQLAEFSVIRGY
ncbi:polyprenyl synthetase family protein [Candidatus Spongiihabitans sp.]|uniref:polyprenyl synthetase family protein n=1 Tax=Candidatus Spongiihabitans sp. TaxID=3101308 RepID=UPI003C7B1B46